MQQITLERDQSARLLGLGLRLFLTASLTASQTPGGYAPFALGAVAASGSGAEGTASLLGAIIGALIFLDFGTALPFLAVVLLILATATAFRDTVLSGRLARFLPLLSTGLFLSVAGIYVLQALDPVAQLAPCAAAAILVGLATYFYQPLLLPGQEHLTPESLFFLVASLLLALEDFTLLDLSLGRCALCALILAAGYSQGAMVGAAAGLGIGLAADFCSGSGAALFTAVYGVSGLAAGSRGSRRRSSAVLWFLAAALVVLLPVRHELSQGLLMEMGAGCGIFLLLPGRLFGGKRVARSTPTEGGSTSGMERMKAQLNRTASARALPAEPAPCGLYLPGGRRDRCDLAPDDAAIKEKRPRVQFAPGGVLKLRSTGGCDSHIRPLAIWELKIGVLGKECPGGVRISVDLGLQCIQGVEADLVPNMGVEIHPDPLAVKVAVKVQNPGLHRDVHTVVHRGTGATVQPAAAACPPPPSF